MKNDILAKLSLLQIESFLFRNGWQVKINNDLNLPYKQFYYENHFNQILLPNNKSNIDYAYLYMIEDTLSRISKTNNTTIDHLILEFSNPNKEIFFIKHVNTNNKDNNNISSESMLNIIQNSKKMFISAYADINYPKEERKKYRRGNYPRELKEIEKKIEFGQSLSGSYIIPVIVPSRYKEENLLYPTNLFDEKSLLDFESDEVNLAINKLVNSVKIISKINDFENDKHLEELLDINNENFISLDFMNSLSNFGINTDENIELNFYTSSESIDMIANISTNKTGYLRDFVQRNKDQHDLSNEFIGKLSSIDADPETNNRTKIIIKLVGTPFHSISTNKQTLTCEFDYSRFNQIIFDVMEHGKIVHVRGDRIKNSLINCELKVIEKF